MPISCFRSCCVFCNLITGVWLYLCRITDAPTKSVKLKRWIEFDFRYLFCILCQDTWNSKMSCVYLIYVVYNYLSHSSQTMIIKCYLHWYIGFIIFTSRSYLCCHVFALMQWFCLTAMLVTSVNFTGWNSNIKWVKLKDAEKLAKDK